MANISGSRLLQIAVTLVMLYNIGGQRNEDNSRYLKVNENRMYVWLYGIYSLKEMDLSFNSSNMDKSFNNNTAIYMCGQICDKYYFFGIKNTTCYCITHLPFIHEMRADTSQPIDVYFKERQIKVKTNHAFKGGCISANVSKEVLRRCIVVEFDNYGFSLSEVDCDKNYSVNCQTLYTNGTIMYKYLNVSCNWYTAKNLCDNKGWTLFNGHDFNLEEFNTTESRNKTFWSGLLGLIERKKWTRHNYDETSRLLHTNVANVRGSSFSLLRTTYIINNLYSNMSTAILVLATAVYIMGQAESLVSKLISPDSSTTISHKATNNRKTNTAQQESSSILKTSKVQSSKYSSGRTHAYDYKDTTYISPLLTPVRIMDSSSTMSNSVTNSKQANKASSGSSSVSKTSKFQSSLTSSKYSSRVYGFNDTTYISPLITSVKIVDSSSTLSNQVTNRKQTIKVPPESSSVSKTAKFQSLVKSSKYYSGSTRVYGFKDTTYIVDSSSTMSVTNRKQTNKDISNGVLGTIVAVVIVVAAVIIIGITIYLKRRRRSNVEEIKDDEKLALQTSNQIHNIPPGCQKVDTKTALSETSLSEVQAENRSRITHINTLYGHSAIHSNNIHVDNKNVPDSRNTDAKDNVYAVVTKPKNLQKTSGNGTGKLCQQIHSIVDGEHIAMHEKVMKTRKEAKDQNGKDLNLQHVNDNDLSGYDHLHSMKITGSRKKTDGNDDVYDHTGHHGTSSDRDLYDHFDNKRPSRADSTYDTTKPGTTCDRNYDTYDHMQHGGKLMSTADDVYDRLTDM